MGDSLRRIAMSDAMQLKLSSDQVRVLYHALKHVKRGLESEEGVSGWDARDMKLLEEIFNPVSAVFNLEAHGLGNPGA
jgi:hypothetical protein